MSSPTDTTAFSIALAAFVIAILQVVQQYAATSTVRNKVGRAAIGVWAHRNKRGRNLAEWKIPLKYQQPTLTWECVEKCLEAQDDYERQLLAPLMNKYQMAAAGSIVLSPQGIKFAKSLQLRLTGAGGDPEEGKPEVSSGSLSWSQRRALSKYYRFLSQRDAPRDDAATATWAMLMAALVGNPLDLARLTNISYVDADTIPSSLDNPTMPIHFSDLISCGVALDMQVIAVDLHRPAIHMTAQYCNIMSQEQSGVGVIARYTCKPGHVHHLQTCRPPEIHTLTLTAKGYLRIGDAGAHMTDWGYNSVDALFATHLAQMKHEDWCQMSVMHAFRSRCEGDTDVQWGGNWSEPATPRVGFLLSHCGNPAVATSFPHSLLKDWPSSDRILVGQGACNAISQAIGFIEAPSNFCSLLHSNGVVMNHYKLANNWGAEHGGVRSWAMSVGAEFVRKVSECWVVPGQVEQVPVLANLRKPLEQGEFSLEWGRRFSTKTFDQEAKDWTPKAETLCWIQLMMLDTWIARRVDLMILGKAKTEEASVPVDATTARTCALLAMIGADDSKGKTTGWKGSRSSFIRLYLARLADGIVQKDGTRIGVSCMSPGGGIGSAGWEGMSVGEPNDWSVLDAALSLRAVLMATRLELLYNTDVFLELQEFDPMIRMA
ncbi:hypothetical protein FB451DRAFT_1362853 [Mycena latifolia]|nr:hypothetical protein FB451DRAFT_1362853 [Mycena latifolia]